MAFERPAETIEEAETIPLFKGISSWADLETTIDAAPGLRTSAGVAYRLEDLADGIAVARATRFGNLQGVTGSENLRETVACLLIEEASSFTELSALIQHIKEISGASEVYSQEMLIQKIQRVVDGVDEPNTLTRTYGLRDTVSRLIASEIQMAA